MGDDFFDFVGVNVEAGYDDEVFFAVDQFEPAFFVHDGDVAGFEKAARVDGFGGFFGAHPVALHHLGAFHPHFARLPLRHGVALRVAQFDFGGGDGQADAAAVCFDVQGVAADAGAGFGEAVGFDDGGAGDAFPFFGHGLLGGHAAAEGEAQVAEIEFGEGGVVDEAVEEGVHADKDADALFFHVAEKGFHVARVGDEDDFGTGVGEDHEVHGEGEDVVEGQGGDDGFFALAQAVFDPFGRLHHVGADVAVAEHRAFGHAGGAAGVLQKGGVGAGEFHFLEGLRRALFHGRLKGDGVFDVVGGHHFFDFAHHKIDDAAFDCAEHVADGGDDDVFDLGVRQHGLEGGGEVFQYDDDGRAAVFELVFEFARGVERVGVDDHHARLQRAEQDDGVLQQVGQHDGDALAARQFEHVLQVGGEVGDELGGFGVGERFAHVLKGGLGGEFGRALGEYVGDGFVAGDVDFGVDAGFVAVEPGFFHVGSFLVF